MTAPKCPVCKINDCEYDSPEPGCDTSYPWMSTCLPCFWLQANAPRCGAQDGHTTPYHTSVKTVPALHADGTLKGYECPECHRKASHRAWIVAAARQCALTTPEWLLQTRVEVQQAHLNNEWLGRTHWATLVYAREFVAQASTRVGV